MKHLYFMLICSHCLFCFALLLVLFGWLVAFCLFVLQRQLNIHTDIYSYILKKFKIEMFSSLHIYHISEYYICYYIDTYDIEHYILCCYVFHYSIVITLTTSFLK